MNLCLCQSPFLSKMNYCITKPRRELQNSVGFSLPCITLFLLGVKLPSGRSFPGSASLSLQQPSDTVQSHSSASCHAPGCLSFCCAIPCLLYHPTHPLCCGSVINALPHPKWFFPCDKPSDHLSGFGLVWFVFFPLLSPNSNEVHLSLL